MFTVGRWRQCQLCYFRVHARVRVCVDDSAARPAAVRHSSSSSATQTLFRQKQTEDFYFDISCGQWADPCRWCVCVGDPVVFGSVERTGRRAAAERERAAGSSFSRLPLDLWILSPVFWIFPAVVSSQSLSGLDSTWTHPHWRPAAFIQPSQLPTFPHFDVWCSVFPAGEFQRPDVQKPNMSSLKCLLKHRLVKLNSYLNTLNIIYIILDWYNRWNGDKYI